MSIAKKPYEISLWEDILTFVGKQTDDTIRPMEGSIESDFEGQIIAQYYKEKKLCIIGSDTMESPIRAVKPQLKTKITGENILTFTMYSHYWDEEENELKWNPFMMYLTNERKVKLKYDNKWYDFIIKDISEDSSSKAFTYTCKDLFINELSKTGFELEFDNELGNNMGTLKELAEKVLEGSDWKFKDENEIIMQYLEEPLYEVSFTGNVNATAMYYPGNNSEYETSITIPAEHKIYVFYSSIEFSKTNNGQEGLKKNIQFLYDPNQTYSLNDKNIIINRVTSGTSGALNCTIADTSGLNTDSLDFVSTKRGERLVKSQKTWFDPKLKRTVKLYNNGAVCGYSETDYVSPSAVSSYIANSKDFTNANGWYVGKTATTESFPDLTVEVYPELTGISIDSDYEGHSYLKFTPKYTGQVLMNSGIINNRTSIGKFTEGDEYVFQWETYDSLSGTMTNIDSLVNNIRICEYTFADGIYTLPQNTEGDLFSKIEQISLSADSTDSSSANYKWKFRCNYSISEEAFKNKKIGIFYTDTEKNSIYIKNWEFYPYKIVTIENVDVVCTPESSFEAKIVTKDVYYDKTSAYTSIEDLSLLPSDGNYTPYYGAGAMPYEKTRSITAKESNRFNLLQSLSELFESWIRFEIEHDLSGEISLDNNYRQKKWISYKQQLGEDNPIGFTYGINLKSIKRTLNSNGTISKIIVKNNANSFAKNGYCSIARAFENPSGENAIYNFDYYVGQGLIDFSDLNNDLYAQPNNPQGYLGYYSSLKNLNSNAQGWIELQSNLSTDLANYDSQYTTYKTSAEAAEEEKTRKEIEFRDLTSFELSDALPQYQVYNKDKHGEINLDKDNNWEFYTKDGENYLKITEVPEASTEGSIIYYARLKWWDNKEARAIRDSYARAAVVARDHTIIYENSYGQKVILEAQLNAIKEHLEGIREQKLVLNQAFYKKYSRFIQEGSWISEDYIDDNLYYIDALSTLYTSSRPQVAYTIDVVELSRLEGYEDFVFSLGDKTYVEDEEFFGRALNGSDQLYREEVVVTELIMELDSPESNKIKVQNYKTQFEDLFQRVVATTQQIQFSTGEYKRSASIVNPDGTINITTLENSFVNNALTLQNAKNQSVIIGDDGITTTNLFRPSDIVRITSGGIFLTQNGGDTWTAGITASGINASCITTGQLNVSEVNLTMGQHVAFRWDSLGISAYKRDNNGIHPGTFTRFDQFGLYGIDGSTEFNPLDLPKDKGSEYTSEQYIRDSALFGLTWNGFWLKSNHGDGYVSISSDNDFEVIRKNNNQEVSVVQIGRLGDSTNGFYYGIRINDLTGSPVLESNGSGELWLKKLLSVATSSNNNTVTIGNQGIETGQSASYTNANKVFDANGNFKIYEDGHVVGTSAHFSGGSTFEGTINATGGTIGGLEIDEWKDMGYSLKLTSEKGFVLKDGETTTLTAVIYHGTNPAPTQGKTVTYQWKRGEQILTGETDATCDFDGFADGETTVKYTCSATYPRGENDSITIPNEIVLIKVSDAEPLNYVIQSNYDNVYRFEEGSNDSEQTTITFAPQIMHFQVLDLSTNSLISSFGWDILYHNGTNFVPIKTDSQPNWLTTNEIVTYNDATPWNILNFDILKLYEKTNIDDFEALHEQIKKGYAMFRLDYKDGSIIKATKYFSIKYGVNANMATFHITASGFVSAIRDTSLHFGSEGLTLENGDFTIEKVAYEQIIFSDEDSFNKNKSELYTIDNNGSYIKLEDNASYDDSNQTPYFTRTSEKVLYFNENEKKLNVVGYIKAEDGIFNGTITADAGYIGGLTIEEGRLTSNQENTSINNNGKYPLEIYSDGNIYAENIELGGQARITDKLIFSDGSTTYSALYNPNIHNGKILQAANVNLKNDGRLTLGTLELYGGTGNVDGYIRSFRLDDNSQKVRGEWVINEDGSAIFDDITVNNAHIQNAILEAKTVQTVGSTMIFNDAWTIIEPSDSYWADSNNYYYHVYHIDGIPSFSADDYVLIDNDVYKVRASRLSRTIDDVVYYGFALYEDYLYLSPKLKIGQIVTKLGSGGTREYVKSTDRERVDGRFYYEKKSDGTYNLYTGLDVSTNCYYLKTSASDDCVISITGDSSPSMALGDTAFASPTSLCFSSFCDIGTDSNPNLAYTKHLILGKLENSGIDDLRDIGGYGLYADNVYLNGSLITRNLINDDAAALCYAGINTLSDVSFNKTAAGIPSDTSAIIFWGGATGKTPAEIKDATFQVTQNGTLYTKQAIIENSAFVGGDLYAANLYAVNIHGNGADTNSPGLTIFGKNTGIIFKSEAGSETFTIGNDGLAKGNKEFVSLTNDQISLKAYSTNDSAGKNSEFLADSIRFYKNSSSFNAAEEIAGIYTSFGDANQIKIKEAKAQGGLSVYNQKIVMELNSYFDNELYYGKKDNVYIMEQRIVKSNNQVVGYDIIIH